MRHNGGRIRDRAVRAAVLIEEKLEPLGYVQLVFLESSMAV